MLKPTNANLAKFFGYSAVSISTYKNSKDIKDKRRYYAMRDYFKSYHGINDAL